MNLRPYQRDALDRVHASLNVDPVLVLPTGGGKTYCAAQLVREIGGRTLWLAHRRELIKQASQSLKDLGLCVGSIMAGEPENADLPVQVASIQTLRRRDLPPADLIVVDEAHHARASTYGDVLIRYNAAKIVGLTATPFRLDGKGLGDVFGEIVVGAYPDELCADGTLVEPIVYAPSTPDMSRVRMRGSDFDEEESSKRILVGDVVETWLKRAKDRRTVVYACTVDHSRKIVAAFREAGVKAEHIDGTTKKSLRDAVLYRLRHGHNTVVSNVQVLEEGWDLPALECAIDAQPTASLCRHLQKVGRAMRSCEGKGGCIVEGSLVLTENGLVPIERVSRFDRVWDGIQWVHHKGAVCHGERDVITHDGLTATPDHRVWTAKGWKTIGQCAVEQIPIVQTGSGGEAIRLRGNHLARMRAPWDGAEAIRSNAVRVLSGGGDGLVHESRAWPDGRLSRMQPAAARSEVALCAATGGAAPLPAAGLAGVSQLRGTGDSVPLRIANRGRRLGDRESRHQAGPSDRQDRQRWALRARQYPLVDAAPEHVAHEDEPIHPARPPVQDSVPACAVRGPDASASRGGSLLRGDRAPVGDAFHQAKRRVWDLLDAGPRHCFTVSDRLVHNSIVLDHAGNHLRHGVVTQRLEYSLADNIQEARGRSQSVGGPKACPVCALVVAAGTAECPECGYLFPSGGREVEHVDGELVQFSGPISTGFKSGIKGDESRRPSLEVQQHAWDVLEGQRAANSYRESWTFLKFQERFGFRPLVHRGVVCDPATTSQDVRRAIYARFVEVARSRGITPVWADQQYQAIFGATP